MSIDRTHFFSKLRPELTKRLTPAQVEGFTVIFDEWERQGLKDLRWLAYMLATAWHETATRMEPVIETRRANEATNPSVDTATARLEGSWKAGRMPWVHTPYWRKDKGGLSWLGRGYPQCTHKTNYEKCEAGVGIPFSKDPSLMLVPGPAVKAMFYGMTHGIFTGHKLGDYFSDRKDDSFHARQMINALESAGWVQGYHRVLLAALKP